MWDDGLLVEARAAEGAGEWERAVSCYETAFARLTRGGDGAAAAEILRRLGVVHQQRGEVELAQEALEASLAIAEASGLTEQVASALICLANLELLLGRILQAERIYHEARRVAVDARDQRLTAMAEQNLGTIASIRGELDVALEHYQRVLECYRSMGGQEHAAAGILINTGMAHCHRDRWREAEDALDEALALAEQLRDANLLGVAQINRAELFFRQERYDVARDCADRAFEIFGRLGSSSGRAEAYRLFGMLCRETSRLQQADAHLNSAVRLAQQCHDRLLEAEALSEWALVHLAEQRNREALHCLNRAHHIFGELSARRELLDLDRRLDGLEGTYLQVVAAWAESIESKDRYTAGHCARVANYACMLAEAVGITGRDLTWMRMGGYLHDVGKIVIPDEVLNKPGKLSDEEFRLVQSHTVEGDAIVAELNFPWDVRPVVRWHHERWDGSGYPDGLRGEEIPLTARILCVADVYDALTTTRSYRPAMSQREALQIMERDVGRFFDPALFPLFQSLVLRATPPQDQRFPEFSPPRPAAA